jgi:hypothetical protein
MRMAQRLSDSLCASMTFPDLRRLRERNERQGCGGGASVLTLHSAPLCCSSIILLSCGVSHTGKRTSAAMSFAMGILVQAAVRQMYSRDQLVVMMLVRARACHIRLWLQLGKYV